MHIHVFVHGLWFKRPVNLWVLHSVTMDTFISARNGKFIDILAKSEDD